MQYKNQIKDFWILRLCGLAAFVLGVAVMNGWITGQTLFIQVSTVYVPMQFNTALCFSLTGLMLLSIGFRKYLMASVFAVVILLLAGLTAVEYLFEKNFGIDEFFIKSDIMTRTTHAGRMAPATALCFILSATTVLLPKRLRLLVPGFVAAISVISLLALFSYLAGFNEIYGFGILTRMAIHTVLGFLIVSLGLSFFVLFIFKELNREMWTGVPVIVAVVGTVLTLLSAYSIDEITKKQNYVYFEDLIADSEDALYARFVSYRQAMIGALGLLQSSEKVTRQEWRHYVQTIQVERYLQGVDGIGYVEYVHEDDLDEFLKEVRSDGAPQFTNHPETPYPYKYIVKYVEPIKQNSRALGLDLAFEKERKKAFERARDTGQPTLSGKIDLLRSYQKSAGFHLMIPHYERGNKRSFKGVVIAPFIADYFFRDMSSFSDEQIDLRVYDGLKESPENILYSGSLYDESYNGLFAKTSYFDIAGHKWSIKWQATDNFTRPYNKNESLYALIFGLLITFSVTLIIRQLVLRRELVEEEVKKRTRDLEDTRQRLRLVMDNIPDPVFLYDENFYLIDANPAFLSFFNIQQRSDVVGKTIQEVFVDEEVDAFIEAAQEAFDVGASSCEQRFVFEDYRALQEQIKILMFNNVSFGDKDGHQYILSVARDVSDLYEAQTKLKESEERFNLAIKAAKVGLWDWDQKTGKFYFNEEWYTILGYEPYELPVRFQTWKDLVHPEDLDYALDNLNRHLDGETPELDSIVRMKHKNGEWVWIRIQGQVLRWNDKGQPARVVGIQIDINDQKQKEIEAEKARLEARRASEMKSEFVANISHELRTPLSGIIGVTELLEKTIMSPKQEGYVDIIHSSGNRLLNLINDVLDFSKIEAGMVQLRTGPVMLEELVEETAKLHALQAMQKNVELGVGYDPDIPDVLIADGVRIQQVLTNLIGNAIKFTDDGRVVLGVHLKEMKNNTVKIRFKVTDQGSGIPEEQLEDIFEKFKQLDSSAAKQHEGTGLGLTITKNLVELMGGEIHVESRRGEGSVFWFDLDLAIGDVEDTQKKPPSGKGRKKQKPASGEQAGVHILVVDDEQVNSLVAKEVLEQMGHQVDIAESGQAALDRIKERMETKKGTLRKKPVPYDLVFMDCMMPGMDGYQATQSIRHYEESHGIARHFIVAMTAKSSGGGDADQYRQAGMDDLYTKPIRRDKLENKMRDWLQGKAE